MYRSQSPYVRKRAAQFQGKQPFSQNESARFPHAPPLDTLHVFASPAAISSFLSLRGTGAEAMTTKEVVAMTEGSSSSDRYSYYGQKGKLPSEDGHYA